MGVAERDLDAEDVKATFERLKTDAATNQYSFANKFVDSVTVVGQTVETATVKTTEPYAWFIARMSSSFNTIPPRELLAGDLSRLSAAGAGAGAYMLQSVGENENALFSAQPELLPQGRGDRRAASVHRRVRVPRGVRPGAVADVVPRRAGAPVLAGRRARRRGSSATIRSTGTRCSRSSPSR